MQFLVNQPCTLLVSNNPGSNYVVLVGGVPTQTTMATGAVASGVVSLTIVPSSTGVMYVVDTSDATIFGPFNIVSKLTTDAIQTITDSVLGSWYWDKIQNTLTLYTQTGSVLATYSVQDSQTVSSRELTS